RSPPEEWGRADPARCVSGRRCGAADEHDSRGALPDAGGGWPSRADPAERSAAGGLLHLWLPGERRCRFRASGTRARSEAPGRWPRGLARHGRSPGTPSVVSQRRRDMKWVTRERPKIDRIACPWLVTRFIDREPEFLFVPGDAVMGTARRLGAVP